jgi:hypothetical protein
MDVVDVVPVLSNPIGKCQREVTVIEGVANNRTSSTTSTGI